jgi:hypothetical protein
MLSPHQKWMASYAPDGNLMLRTIGNMVSSQVAKSGIAVLWSLYLLHMLGSEVSYDSYVST